MTNQTKPLRGFAAVAARDPERMRQIASRGGSAVPEHKRSFSINAELAAAAGRKGGAASHGGGRKAQPKTEG